MEHLGGIRHQAVPGKTPYLTSYRVATRWGERRLKAMGGEVHSFWNRYGWRPELPLEEGSVQSTTQGQTSLSDSYLAASRTALPLALEERMK